MYQSLSSSKFRQKKKHWSQANGSVQSLKLVSKTQKYFVPASIIKGWCTTVQRKIKEIIVDPKLKVRLNSQILVQGPLEACVFRSVSFFIWFFYHGFCFRCCSVVPTVINRILENKLVQYTDACTATYRYAHTLTYTHRMEGKTEREIKREIEGCAHT